jgi:hypothetical protein
MTVETTNNTISNNEISIEISPSTNDNFKENDNKNIIDELKVARYLAGEIIEENHVITNDTDNDNDNNNDNDNDNPKKNYSIKEPSDPIFNVDVPSYLINSTDIKSDKNIKNNTEIETFVQQNQDDWDKMEGWYNELNFYSKVFQYFGEIIKDKESMFGWWIILISSLSSFITLFSLEPFTLSEQHSTLYNWVKSITISILSMLTTLIASWVKKKAYITRIQIIDKRINRLEKFLGKLDYQIRLVPDDMRVPYHEFITEMRDEYTELSIYTDILRPAEFTYTVYLITRFNSPMIRNTWPWYDTVTREPRREFARNIINTYELQYGFWADFWCCFEPKIDQYNPLLNNLSLECSKNKKNDNSPSAKGKDTTDKNYSSKQNL